MQAARLPPTGTGLYVTGTEGTLTLENTRGLAVSLYNKGGLAFPGSHVYAHPLEDNFAAEISHLADCARADAEPENSLEYSRNVIVALRAACESFQTGAAVEVRYA